MNSKISVFNSSSHKFLPKKKVQDRLKEVFLSESVDLSWVNVIYLNDDEIHQMNKEHLEHDYPTDVITFELEKEPLEGEIYIGTDTAIYQAKEYKVSSSNEMQRLAIHGALHLCGYDDKTDEQKQLMRQKEDFYLADTRKNS
jgi:rRNA maturation RNase YbeY